MSIMTKTTLMSISHGCLDVDDGKALPESAVADITGFLVDRCITWYHLRWSQSRSQ